MVRFKGTPPYVEFVEVGEAPYDDQPAFDTALGFDDLAWDLHLLFSRRAPLLSPLRPRPLAAIVLDIDRATIPAMRAEDI